VGCLRGAHFSQEWPSRKQGTIQGILHNLIYTGDFEFCGKPYKGIHERTISRELWDEVQLVLGRRYSNHYRVIKHDLPFSGMTRCGHCGCGCRRNEEGEIHLLPLHMPAWKMPKKYARQELIEAQFWDAVSRIVLPEPFVKWASDALRLANADDACLREDAISHLTVERDASENVWMRCTSIN
jgi:site-specific DNA recombinase